MDASPAQHLSQISTHWTQLAQAHGADGCAVSAAQRAILERYSPAIFRYLVGCVGDWNVAEELFQEFAVRFLQGKFSNARPERGRFRDYLKTALRHLLHDHRRRQKPAVPLTEVGEVSDAAATPAQEDLDRFVSAWRTEALDRTWQALLSHERETGQPYHTVLRFRTEHPKMPSAEVAQHLQAQLGKAVSAVWVRQKLFLARQEFTRLLVKEVRATLDADADDADLERELTDLGLLEYCRDFLTRRQQRDS